MSVSEENQSPGTEPQRNTEDPQGSTTDQRRSGLGWWLAAGFLALVCLALFLHLFFRTPPIIEKVVEVPATVTSGDSERVARYQEILEVRRDTLSRSVERVEGPRCNAPSTLDQDRLISLRRAMSGDLERWHALLMQPVTEPTTQGTSVFPDNLPTDNSAETLPPAENQTAGEVRSEGIGALRNRLEKGTVLILALPPKGEGGLSTGTGFFISDELIATNLHVIDSADRSNIYVTSAALGHLIQASLVAETAGTDPGTPDFAVLRVEDAKAPAILPLAREKAKLSPVIAAGFPGMSLLHDAGFRALLAGDLSSAPDLNMNRGEIRSVRSLGNLFQIVHTADVLKGYSGGPLIDTCGRAIGMNTLIQVDSEQASKLNTAQTVDALTAFLGKNGLALPVDERPCVTSASR